MRVFFRKRIYSSLAIIIFVVWDVVWTYIFKKTTGSNYGIILLIFLALASYECIKQDGFFIFLRSSPTKYWFMWVAFVFINTWFLQATPEENRSISIFMFLLIPLIIVLSLRTADLNGLNNFINISLLALFLRTVLSLIFDSYGLGNGGYRFGIVYNSNMIAFTVLIMYLLNLLKRAMGFNNSILTIAVTLTTVALLLMTQSRKSFLVFLIIILGESLIFSKANKAIRLIKLLFVATLLGGGFWFILNNTELGVRIMATAEQTISASDNEEMFDGRLVQYVQGFMVFQKNPIFGIGLFNYRYIDRYGLELHSEYLTQLVEAGIVGSVLFMLFYRGFMKSSYFLLTNGPLPKTGAVLLLIGMSYFILFTATWIYNIPMFWLPIAIGTRLFQLTKNLQ